MIDRKVRELKEEDLVLISETYHNWLNNNNYEDKKGFCKSASLEEIREADYTLVPGRYVGIDDSDKMNEEEIDAEIAKLAEQYQMEADQIKKAVPADQIAADVKTKKAIDVIVDSAVKE